MHEYGFPLVGKKELDADGYDAVVLAVAHDKFKELDIKSLKRKNGVVFDVKSFLDPGVVDGRL